MVTFRPQGLQQWQKLVKPTSGSVWGKQDSLPQSYYHQTKGQKERNKVLLFALQVVDFDSFCSLLLRYTTPPCSPHWDCKPTDE